MKNLKEIASSAIHRRGGKIFYILLSLSFLTIPFFIMAQSSITNPPVQSSLTNPPASISVKIDNPFKGGNDLVSVVNTILKNVVMPLAAVLVVLAIIYSGFKYVTAQGKPEEIRKANEGLMYVLIGAAVLLGAVGISEAIQGTLKPLLNI